MKQRLTTNVWVMKSMVDVTTNTGIEISKSKYQFIEDGTYIVTPENSEPHFSKWYLTDGGDYLVIGSNTYKIKIITKNLLGLSCGSLEIFYVPL